MSDKDPEMCYIQELTGKISRRRLKIKSVEKTSQVSLWGQKGSYEPNQYKSVITGGDKKGMWARLHQKTTEKIKQSGFEFPPRDLSSDRELSHLDHNNLTEKNEAQKYFKRESHTVAQTHNAVLKNVPEQNNEDSYTFKDYEQ